MFSDSEGLWVKQNEKKYKDFSVNLLLHLFGSSLSPSCATFKKDEACTENWSWNVVDKELKSFII